MDVDESSFEGVEGIWTGTYIRYPDVFYLELELTAQGAAGQSLNGELRILPLKQRQAGREAKDYGATASATVNFDPLTDSFTMTVGRADGVDRMGVAQALRRVEGVLDRSRKRLAGRDSGRGESLDRYFVFTRPSAFEPFAKRMAGFHSGPFNPGIGRLFGGGAPSKKALEKWYAPYAAEYGANSAWTTAYGTLEARVAPLFEDEHFKSAFGETYDDLSLAELHSIYVELRGEPGGADSNFQKELKALSPMFSPSIATTSAMFTTQAIFAQRSIRSWRATHMVGIETGQGGAAKFENIEGIASRVVQLSSDVVWPSVSEAPEVLALQAQSGLKVPQLDAALAAVEGRNPSLESLGRIVNWRVSSQQGMSLVPVASMQAFDARYVAAVDRQLDVLVPPLRAELSQLGTGLAAVEAGNAWYRDFERNFGAVLDRPACRMVRDEFLTRRRGDLESARSEMQAALRQPFEALPASYDASQAASQARVAYRAAMDELTSSWFEIQEDRNSPVRKDIVALAADYSSRACRLLSPFERQSLGLGTSDSSPTLPDYGRLPCPKLTYEVARSTKSDSEVLWRMDLPGPVTDPGFVFESNVCWAIFNGRFDLLAPELYQDVLGMGAKLIGQRDGANVLLDYAFVTFVGLATSAYGEEQIGPSTELYWTTANSKKERVVYISHYLSPYYEDSYLRSNSAADSDALYGDGSIAGLLGSLLETREQLAEAAFGSPESLLDQLTRRADGSVAFRGADWERGIMADTARLLMTWPKHAQAIWQYQENINRYLEGRPSLQDVARLNQSDLGLNELHLAAQSGNVSIVTLAIDRGANPSVRDALGRTPLHLAVVCSSPSMVRVLVASGADIRASDKMGMTPLHIAARYDRTDIAGELAAADVNARSMFGNTPLHEAARLDSVDMALWLIENGAAIDAKDDEGQQPLHAAAAGGADSMIELLTSRGVGVDCPDAESLTPLHIAARSRSAATVGVLAALGADVHARSGVGDTPLHLAAEGRGEETIAALLLRGADPEAKNAAGRTPLDVAIATNDEGVIRAMRGLR